jgi:transcription elongation factor GreA-like protein
LSSFGSSLNTFTDGAYTTNNLCSSLNGILNNVLANALNGLKAAFIYGLTKLSFRLLNNVALVFFAFFDNVFKATRQWIVYGHKVTDTFDNAKAGVNRGNNRIV